MFRGEKTTRKLLDHRIVYITPSYKLFDNIIEKFFKFFEDLQVKLPKHHRDKQIKVIGETYSFYEFE